MNGRRIRWRAVVSNANLKLTIFRLVGEEYFDRKFVDEARAVRLNNSSTQVYMALKPGTRSTRAWATCCSARRRASFAPTCS